MASRKRVWFVYLGGLFLALHYALIIYVNSSFLKQFMQESAISALYVLGSAVSVGLFLNAGRILRHFGNLTTFFIFLILELISMVGIFSADSASSAAFFFIIHQAVISLIFYNLDIFLEREQEVEENTGNRRGAFLTFQNIAWISAPIISGFIANAFGLKNVYLLASILIIPPAIILGKIFYGRIHPPIRTTSLIEIYHFLRTKSDLKRILLSNILLQFFYATMVIFIPIFLIESLGFNWQQTGIIFTIMLLPFLILEWPLGYIADKKLGEKEILGFGFITMGFATLIVSITSSTAFSVWALLLFATRIGASAVEIGNEAYFFRQVKERDAGIIGLFRMTRPLAYVLSPIFAYIVLSFAGVRTLFFLLALLTLLGLIFIPKKDTR